MSVYLSKAFITAQHFFLWIYKRLALIGSLLFFVFALASYFKTPWYVPELFTHFQVQLFLICGLVFSILILLTPKTPPAVYIFLTASLVLFFLNIAPYINLSRLIPGQSLEKRVVLQQDKTYVLLQANLFKFNFNEQPMIDLIRTTNPDILVVYEMTPEWEKALSSLSDIFPYGAQIPHNGSQGIGLYARHPVENLKTVYMSNSLNPAQTARIRLPLGDVHLVSLHPRPPMNQSMYDNRNQHLNWLIRNISNSHDKPLIVAGDLNTTMFAPQYKSMVRKTGLTNARLGRGLQNSWFIYGNKFTGIPIDHFLYNERIKVIESSVTPDVKSDHLPLITYFEIVE